MAKVSCDGCGDTHECSAAQAPATGAVTTKPKRKLNPKIAAQNAQRQAEAQARREGGNGSAQTATHGTAKKSIVRELLGW